MRACCLQDESDDILPGVSSRCTFTHAHFFLSADTNTDADDNMAAWPTALDQLASTQPQPVLDQLASTQPGTTPLPVTVGYNHLWRPELLQDISAVAASLPQLHVSRHVHVCIRGSYGKDMVYVCVWFAHIYVTINILYVIYIFYINNPVYS